MPRLPLIPPREWSHGMRVAVSLLLPPPGYRPPRDDGRPKPEGVLETFAHHPDLAKAYFAYNRHVLWETSLPPRLRHILIMRVAARRRAEFLQHQHTPQALDAGLTAKEIRLLSVEPRAPLPDVLDAALSQAVDEWLDGGAIAPTTWSTLAEGFDCAPQQLLDVLFTIGCYVTIAGFMRSVDLRVPAPPAEPDAP